LKEYPQAQSSLRKALQLDSLNQLYLQQLASLLYESEKYEASLGLADTLLVIDPGNRGFMILKGQSLQRLNLLYESREVFYQLYEDDTLNTWNIKQLASLNTRMDSVTEAIFWTEKAVAMDSMDMRSYIRLGSLYVRAEKYEEGREELTKAISRDSSQALIFRFRGALSIMGALFSEAEHDFSMAIHLGDSTAFSFRHYGLSLFKQSKHLEAIPVYQKTIKLDPEDAQAWYYLGFCYKWNEDIPMAIQCLEKALELSVTPSISDVYIGLGQFHGLNRDFQKAIHNYSRAYEWDPENAIPLAQLGMLIEESGGEKKHARNYYKAFIKQANPLEHTYLIQYLNNRIDIINEGLFMEGKLEKEN